MKTVLIILLAMLIVGSVLVIDVTRAHQTGIKRTDSDLCREITNRNDEIQCNQPRIFHLEVFMTISKETKTLNMPWEREYGYAQAAKVGDTIYLSGQVSHDADGNLVGVGEMETQMRQAYANVAILLKEYGAGMENIVDEVLFVKDMEAAFAARVKCRQDVFGGFPAVASTIVQIERLAFPELLIEIKCVAKV